VHEDAAIGWAMVHAGLPPEWDIATARQLGAEVSAALAADPAGFFAAMYGDRPARWSPGLRGVDRLRFAVNCLTRLRFLSADGRLLLKYKGPLDSAPAGARPWFRAPGRRSAGTRIVFGHWSALGYCESDGVVSLDTGCVWGGALTAVRLDRSAPPVQVGCRGALRIGAPEDAAADY
jgi:bis(5'-nucleosyl)-tetraphosphatase (symmetrical)